MADIVEASEARPSKEELSQIDRRLITWYGTKTVAEMAEATGLEETEVVQRLNERLGSVNFLGLPAKINKLLYQMDEVNDEIMSRIKDASDRNIAPMTNTVRSNTSVALKEIREIMADMERDNDEIKRQYAAMLVDMIRLSYFSYLDKLQVSFPEVDRRELESGFMVELRSTAKEFHVD